MAGDRQIPQCANAAHRTPNSFAACSVDHTIFIPHQIGDHLGVYAATVSRRLKQAASTEFSL